MIGSEKIQNPNSIKNDKNCADKVIRIMNKLISQKDISEVAWKQIINKPGINIWRVKSFKLETVPASHHGTFYGGDSYIVLHTYEGHAKKILYDVFAWIGLDSTADEYGVAAYKMAELDNIILNGAAVQHREVENAESEKFHSLFPRLSILQGGYETGFKKVDHTFTPRLLHIFGIRKNVKVMEVSYIKDNLSNDDVFIIDNGEKIYQVNGKAASKDEKFKGGQVLEYIKSDRGKCHSEVIDNYEIGLPHPAINNLPVTGNATTKKPEVVNKKHSLWRVSDSTGKLAITHVKDGKCSKGDFNTKDVLIYDTNHEIFIWNGKDAEKNEKIMAMGSAYKYSENNDKKSLTMVGVKEGQETQEFLAELQ